jgi:hypothetical protein
VGKVLLFLIELTLGIALPRWIVRRDLAQLDPTRSARAWNDASFWVSVVVFGPLCLPFHFAKTRRSLLGGAPRICLDGRGKRSSPFFKGRATIGSNLLGSRLRLALSEGKLVSAAISSVRLSNSAAPESSSWNQAAMVTALALAHRSIALR